jgi:alpha-D-ribose 1-methylphosphonate 5-triphosphate synthase subunit PhnH
MRPGLADPVLDSQAVFRRVLEATAHPGRIVTIDRSIDVSPPLQAATAAVCLTLLDFETPLWLDHASRSPEVVEWLRLHAGVPIVDTPGEARFAVIADAAGMPGLDAFDPGTDALPDRSATLIVQAAALAAGRGVRLTGPGVRDTTRLEIGGIRDGLWSELRMNGARFPRGVDLIVTAGRQLAALPRTVRVEAP